MSHYADICGQRFIRQRKARIVGGEVAAFEDWPWQVIYYDIYINQAGFSTGFFESSKSVFVFPANKLKSVDHTKKCKK
jgi:hypothetical protein